MPKTADIAELSRLIGQEIGVSDWITVDQARIDSFAHATDDHQFIHVDPEAAAPSPFGGTIAHGFLTLSLLSAMSYQVMPEVRGAAMGVNYGLNRVRFISPVKSGARIRGRFVLVDVSETKPGEITFKLNVTVEIEGQEKPALVAEWINRRYLDGAS
ncbi:MaoC family dehydratase [Actibacterium lipolyticum]|uniref:Putative enoyl-CoA hydratase 1 n=1 Tax=Actibacterium lipolyticum TaxID=1524263 RepID=A0A238KN76_9RHOB|nr:MaoC family dehydratase [Actibacterium lipolyticum]SMX44263.1 putative enoyl-CoA hydratase 1 [Actibacterium lipolyticum]